jgi:type IV pilus assembly protein PilA
VLARIRKAMEEREEGFTLIELLVVIIIIGILAAIAIPVFLNQRKKGYDAQVKADLRNAATAEETYLTGHPAGYSTDQADLTANGWKSSTNDSFVIAIAGARGFCLVGNNSNSDNFYLYDSNAGGLQATAYSGATAQADAEGACDGGATATVALSAWA